MRRFALVALAAIPSALLAQVPYGYVIVSESVPATSTAMPLNYLQVPSGVVTPLRWISTARNTMIGTPIALDPADPRTLYGRTLLSTINSVSYIAATLEGSRVPGTRTVQIMGVVGSIVRLHIAGSDLLFTLGGTNANAGLWRFPLAGGQAQQLAALPNARDIAMLANKAYVVSFATMAPSTLVEVDLTTRMPRTVSSSLPSMQSIAAFGGNLMAGLENGDLGIVNPGTGSYQTFMSPNRGAIIAVVVPPASLPVFATAREVYVVPNLTTPIYQSTATISDLEAGIHDQASQLFYGDGCVGTNNKAPASFFTGLPSLGNAQFRLAITDARANAPSVMLIGVTRQSIDLGPIGMPTCKLLTDIKVALGFVTDGLGAGGIPLAVPNDPGLKGGHLMAQAVVTDAGANQRGAVVAEGIECIVR
jgi:hypothetical protein